MMNGKAWNNDSIFTFDDFGFTSPPSEYAIRPATFNGASRKLYSKSPPYFSTLSLFPSALSISLLPLTLSDGESVWLSTTLKTWFSPALNANRLVPFSMT